MLKIGNGFNSATKQIMPSSIFGSSIKADINPDIGGQLRYFSSVFHSVDDYKKNFSNSFKIDAPIPVADSAFGLGLNVARDVKRNNDNLVYVLRIVKIEKKENFQEISPVLADPKVQTELTNNQNTLANIYNNYGDSYISSISYGKEAVVTIEFQNTDIETTQKIDALLNLNFTDKIKLENITALEKIIRNNKTNYNIDIKTKGFKESHLPPVLPRKISDLEEWLKILQKKFDDPNASNFSDQLEYEATPYSYILAGSTVNVTELSMKAFIIGQYLSSIEKCKAAIERYKKYYAFLGNSDQILTNLELFNQALTSIDMLLRINSNLSEPLVSNAIKRLRGIVTILNELNDKYSKVVSTITEKNFGGDVIDIEIHNQRHISNNFQIDLDSGLEIDRFSFKVTNPKNRLDGTLGLYYSLDKDIPFNSRSQPIANNISYGNSTAAIPHDLSARGLKNMFFGFHYDGFKRSGFDIKNPVQIETTVNYKMPEEIYLDDLGNIDDIINAIRPRLVA